MSKTPLFTLSVSNNLSEKEYKQLITTMRNVVDVDQMSHQRFSPDWQEYIVYIKDIGVVAGAASAFVKLANEINTWRRGALGRGEIPKIKLNRPNKPALDVERASDEEVAEWFKGINIPSSGKA